jgi:hypothetical protein
MDAQTKQVLVSTLEILREQTAYTQRLHGWVIAVHETIEHDEAFRSVLRAHPSYDQGPRPDLHITASLLAKLDALIQQLTLQA